MTNLTSESEINPVIQQHPFHVLLPQHATALRRQALKLTGNVTRAEDLVQETLLKAWASRDSYRPDTQLRAWLFTILRNTFISDLRKVRREVEDVDGACAGSLSEEPRQDHVLALKELISALALLPSTQRKALLLMGAYGYSQQEAASACRCTVGTIKSRVSRSRATLSRILEPEDAAPVDGVSCHGDPRDEAIPPSRGGAVPALMGAGAGSR
jgi:RNA polymerase sigma-70 factor, ECF subfamily